MLEITLTERPARIDGLSEQRAGQVADAVHSIAVMMFARRWDGVAMIIAPKAKPSAHIIETGPPVVASVRKYNEAIRRLW